jgi:hypothetical protein
VTTCSDVSNKDSRNAKSSAASNSFASDFVIEIRWFLTQRWEAFGPDPEEG